MPEREKKTVFSLLDCESLEFPSFLHSPHTKLLRKIVSETLTNKRKEFKKEEIGTSLETDICTYHSEYYDFIQKHDIKIKIEKNSKYEQFEICCA